MFGPVLLEHALALAAIAPDASIAAAVGGKAGGASGYDPARLLSLAAALKALPALLLDIATRRAPGFALVELAPQGGAGGGAEGAASAAPLPPPVPVPCAGPVLGAWEDVQRFYRDAATAGGGAPTAAEAAAAPAAATPVDDGGEGVDEESLGQAPPPLPLRFVDFCPLLFAQARSTMGGGGGEGLHVPCLSSPHPFAVSSKPGHPCGVVPWGPQSRPRCFLRAPVAPACHLICVLRRVH